MHYDDKVGEWVLSSGRRFYAFSDILGVSVEEPDYLHYGSDGAVHDLHDFTREERREVAETMIARWREWAER
jgi:hypothetical protein